MLESAEFFASQGAVENIRLSAMRLAKYTKTPIGWFLDQPIGDFYEWIQVMNEEVEREEEEMKKAKKGGQ